MTEDELLYGIQGISYRGLLTGAMSYNTRTPTLLPHPGTMTRQRRRAAARAAAKAQG